MGGGGSFLDNYKTSLKGKIRYKGPKHIGSVLRKTKNIKTTKLRCIESTVIKQIRQRSKVGNTRCICPPK